MRIPVKSLCSFFTLHKVLWKTPGEIAIVFASPRRMKGLHSLGWLSSAVTHTQVTHELSKMPRTSQNVARGELEMRSQGLWPMRTSEAHPAYSALLLSPSCFLNSQALKPAHLPQVVQHRKSDCRVPAAPSSGAVLCCTEARLVDSWLPRNLWVRHLLHH